MCRKSRSRLETRKVESGENPDWWRCGVYQYPRFRQDMEYLTESSR